jgi:hypothetical protein
MKAGTIVRLPDGREGTVVFNGLCGVGIKWGRHEVNEHTFAGTYGDVFSPSVEIDDEWPWKPDAWLREEWPGADGLECVGGTVVVLSEVVL